MSVLEKIKLKVCGMRDTDNIMSVASLHPDYMGFIFYEKSPRYVGPGFRLPKNFPSEVKRVGVFVNEDTQNILELTSELHPDYIQLHGKESVAQCAALKKAGFGIIKVFSVDSDFNFDDTKSYKDVVDYFLFDTKGKYHGGNAVTFDWRILEKYDQEVPFFLSGGLTPENVGSVASLSGMNIHALDVNSGFEISPARKDLDKLKTLTHILTTKL